MVGWEHSRESASALAAAERALIDSFGTERATFAMECNRHALTVGRELQGEIGLMLADPVTMAVHSTQPSVPSDECTMSMSPATTN